jgi:ribosomal protein L37E
MNKQLDKVQCKKCGSPVFHVKNEIVPTGIFRSNGKETRYYCCVDSLCGNYNMVIE